MSGVVRRQFRFIREIAEGGFGRVYLAEQLSSDGFSRAVAIKLLHAKWSTHDEIVMRTRDEARLLGLIRHQHIVKVEDLTSIDGKCALVMEYLEGCDLKWMMAHLTETGGVFPRMSLFEIMAATASALDAAFSGAPLTGGEPLRVIHRDIKPSNIFLTVTGGVKVLDFGTARANFAEREAKTQALAFGSQGYMAPERMLGEDDTAAADIFSLGVTLVELLTLEGFGRIPPRPNKFVAKIEERLDAVVLEGSAEWREQVRETLRGMLQYEPAARPSASSLVDTFELLAQGANDVGLRRFCRTNVVQAKAAEPPLAGDDPLTGRTLNEDASSSFLKQGTGGIPQPARPDYEDSSAAAFGHAPPPPPASQLSIIPPPAMPQDTTPDLDAATEEDIRTELQTFDMAAAARADQASAAGREPAPVVQPPPSPVSAPLSAAPPLQAIEDEPAPAGKGRLLLLVVVVLILGLGALGVGGVGLGAAFYMGMTPADVSGMLVDSAPATSSDVVTPPPEADAGPKYTGAELVATDDRTDVPRAKQVVLAVDGAPWADVVVQGTLLKLQWDGRERFELGPAAEGHYRATVTPPDGKKIRGTSFEVVADKECAFTFDVGASDWKGGCE